MKTPDTSYVSVFDNILTCPICKNKQFWHRTTLMNTSGMTFLGMDWLNTEADNYICSKCGYVNWFFGTPTGAIRKSQKESTLLTPKKASKKEEKEDGWWLKVKSE